MPDHPHRLVQLAHVQQPVAIDAPVVHRAADVAIGDLDDLLPGLGSDGKLGHQLAYGLDVSPEARGGGGTSITRTSGENSPGTVAPASEPPEPTFGGPDCGPEGADDVIPDEVCGFGVGTEGAWAERGSAEPILGVPELPAPEGTGD